MASFISTLSLFILILFNGCFTLPIVDEQFSSSTFSLLNDDLTTEHTFNLRLVPDNETIVVPDIDKKNLIDEHLGFEMSTSFYNSPVEKLDHGLRTFDELYTTESMIFTTESPLSDKWDHHDFLFTTIEPTTPFPELERRSFTSEFENETDKHEKQNEFTTHDMLLFTSTASSVAPELYTSEPLTSTSTLTSTEKYTGLLKYHKENQEEQEPEHKTKLTKTVKKVFPTKPINVQPVDQSAEEPEHSTKLKKTAKKVFPIKPTNVQPVDQSAEELEHSTKLTKTVKKVLPTKPINVQPVDQSAEEPSAPTALFDQDALKKISYIPNDFMILDENNTFVVTDHPEKYLASTMKTKHEEQSLTQGKESLQPEEKESNH